MVCQQEIIGRLCTKYLNSLSITSYWQTPDALHKGATITALYKRLWQCACACLMQFPASPCNYLSKPKSKKGQLQYPYNSAHRISPSHTHILIFISYHKAFRVECCEVYACLLPGRSRPDLLVQVVFAFLTLIFSSDQYQSAGVETCGEQTGEKGEGGGIQFNGTPHYQCSQVARLKRGSPN